MVILTAAEWHWLLNGYDVWRIKPVVDRFAQVYGVGHCALTQAPIRYGSFDFATLYTSCNDDTIDAKITMAMRRSVLSADSSVEKSKTRREKQNWAPTSSRNTTVINGTTSGLYQLIVH